LCRRWLVVDRSELLLSSSAWRGKDMMKEGPVGDGEDLDGLLKDLDAILEAWSLSEARLSL